MIDLHSHIFHGFDDGAQSLEESVEMAQMAAEDGIEKIVEVPLTAEEKAGLSKSADGVRKNIALLKL